MLRSGDQPADSVYDFLYHDARRVGSFLAQFEAHGLLSQVRATKGTGSTTTKRTSGGGEVGAPGLAKAQLTSEEATGEENRGAEERTFDPLWQNARALLDYLEQRGMIQRDPWGARVGQFVLAEGSLIVLDTAILQGAWGKPAVKQLIVNGTRATAAAQGSTKPPEEIDAEAQVLIELLALMPHATQAHVVNDTYSAWCGLAEGSLVGMSSDLMLKHGAYVRGTWHVLGVLDAIPDPAGDETTDPAALSPLDMAVAGSVGTMIGGVVAQLAPLARNLFGRPRLSFGLTPLLIFRAVSGSHSAAEP